MFTVELFHNDDRKPYRVSTSNRDLVEAKRIFDYALHVTNYYDSGHIVSEETGEIIAHYSSDKHSISVWYAK